MRHIRRLINHLRRWHRAHTPAELPAEPPMRYDFPGASLGLDPLQRWQLRDAHFDVNGKFGGPLAILAHMEAENGESAILIYHLAACYGDAIRKPKTPKELGLQYVPVRSYRQPYPAGQARLDYCRTYPFADPSDTIGLEPHLLEGRDDD